MSCDSIFTPVTSPDVKIATPDDVASPDTTMTTPIDAKIEAKIEAKEDAEESASGDEDDVPDSEREFICKNNPDIRCRTGQYTTDLSRKVISDYFGRNKACTRDITDWPLFCRKHYQRATYNKALWQIRKLDLIYRQFQIIEDQYPGTTYDIAFKKSEEARLNEYSRKVAAGMSEEEAAKAVEPTDGKGFEAPLLILRELDHDVGKGKTLNEAKDVVERILQMIKDEATEQIPSIEFLPIIPGKGASSVKVPKTPSPKKTRASKTPSPKTPRGRVSAKGSVKKRST